MSRQNRVPLADRVAKAAEAALVARQFVSAIDILVGIGWLDSREVERWRRGQIGCLEGVVRANLPRISEAMRLRALGDRERIVPKSGGVCRSYARPPDAALQPRRKSCD